MPDLKFVALVFGIVLLIVLGVRQAIKKTQKKQKEGLLDVKVKKPAQEKPLLTEEQFTKTWKSLSYLLLLVAAGSLYMVYIAVKAAIDSTAGVAWVYWLDAGFSLAAAAAAGLAWMFKTKSMVFLYFGMNLIPILLFMSLKGFKLNALIHLFPLVLLYFVLKPVWQNLKN